MKIVRTDFRKLQASAFAGILMVAAGGLALYVSFDARKSAEQARAHIAAQFAEADGKLKQVRDEESEVKQKSIVFNTLRERGIIGNEQRLDWVELLKDIRDKHRLIDLRYEIAPQRMLDGQVGNDFVVFASSMRLELKLLHEEDLTRLLDDLQRQAKALIRVKSCRIERLPATGDERGGGRANLMADCEIEWLTLRDVRSK
ncbi:MULTISPECIES: hypothetical protein [unclassified Candidatus Accumulibacter]|jgi:hypothetical protein|uniref:hypothetical protein n=1 Tax=unclassified Candidatus Accumulibacter TaxID=2619054 RepID=UPI0012C92D00|nr:MULTISPECIES: hypothetical protein [unclassified Candidatus Accumulibacter]MBN8514064.1 hypothetical protein [Accumulibacter sp.]MBO3703261.1 hypothetical protein [Accumulibacter sp.]MQM33429.1 hypothetical protein [Candidatus Accumulibacter phosphatis]